MTDKQAAINLIHKMPQGATLEEIMAELYFRQKVDRGLRELHAGEVVSHDEAKRRVEQWLRR